MRRRRAALAGVLLAGVLAGCGEPVTETSPLPTNIPSAPAESAAPATVPPEVLLDPHLEPPLTEFSASIAVPEFLTEEQQDLYRRAHCLYRAMFGGETTAIDNFRPDVEAAEEVPERMEDGPYYCPATGRYRRWADFDAVIHSVFTEGFWLAKNDMGDGTPIYREMDGRLWMADLSRGSGWYNGNFPDQFRLEEQTKDTITFTLICHYTEPYPKDGETYEERDRRLETVVDYTLEFPMKLVLNGDGWRFDEFHFGPSEDSGPVGE